MYGILSLEGRKDNMEYITTSFIDDNYYVINTSRDVELFSFATLLTAYNKTEYANILMKLFSFTRNQKDNLFIDKNSSFGTNLTSLIEKKIIDDESMVLRINKILKAYIQINLQQDNDETTMLKIISDLIKKKYDNINIMTLKEEYDINLLRKIVTLGMQNITSPKELNSNLSGYEEMGYLYDEDGKMYQFNIATKACTLIDENKLTKKREW